MHERNACKIVEMRLSGTFVLPVQDLKGAPRFNQLDLDSANAGAGTMVPEMLPPLEVLNLLGEDVG